eukprot:CAMPEP_0197177266 /NCGR_PEP_ID=MMETSP1423-20130617/2936_1 /TAXON_ID=476441 /ORGANISM="Pseudo-nitzschia heimii, Strain UNC1101" /LENGTH=391 /DNA_ID=CAMNT_0042626789 /DNA_START=97 /DNA_END=1272 /DNA_ORIENTATION=-
MTRPTTSTSISTSTSTPIPAFVDGFSDGLRVVRGGEGRIGRSRQPTRGGSVMFSAPSADGISPSTAASVVHPRFENISIEYCPGCRWMTKAFWMAAEIFSDRSHREIASEITVVPSEPGTFAITGRVLRTAAAETADGEEPRTTMVKLWDRREDGGFPPIDLIEFNRRIGTFLDGLNDVGLGDFDDDVSPTTPEQTEGNVIGRDDGSSTGGGYSHVVIEFSPANLLRAVYYGQELLTTFCDGELEAISLRPVSVDEDDGSSLFSVGLREHRECSRDSGRDPIVLWDYNDDANPSGTRVGAVFPEVKELKRLVRDRVLPQKDLGHSEDKTHQIDAHGGEESSGTAIPTDDVGDCIPCETSASGFSDDDSDDVDDGFIDDDEAEEARRYFGVM